MTNWNFDGLGASEATINYERMSEYLTRQIAERDAELVKLRAELTAAQSANELQRQCWQAAEGEGDELLSKLAALRARLERIETAWRAYDEATHEDEFGLKAGFRAAIAAEPTPTQRRSHER